MYTQIAANKRKTIFLMAGFVGLVYALAWIFSRAYGSPGLVYFALGFAVVYAAFGYFASARIALGLAGAKPIAKRDAPRLYRIVENLAITAGLPTPAIYIINDAAPNAFATGRDPQHAVVAVTSGLLDMMEDNELEGVIAHELSHVGNYDIRVMAIVIVLVTIVSVLGNFFLRVSFFGDDDSSDSNPVMLGLGIAAAILAPIVASVLQLAVSRRREYLADASGALLTRYPQGLASALAKISASKLQLQKASTVTAHLYIASPFKGKAAGFVAGLFSTHPPIADRIAKLEAMEISS